MIELITKQFVIKSLIPKQRHLELVLIDETIDQSTEVLGIVRDNIDIVLNSFKANDRILCQAKSKILKKKQCYEISMMRRVNLSSDLPEMVQDSEQELKQIDENKNKFENFILEVKDNDYHNLLISVFNDDLKSMFYEWPGSKAKHHAYYGGLLEHTIEVVEIAIFLGSYFNEINNDLLITGCLLHDIGKLKSYEIDYTANNCEKTDWEHLLYHVPMSALFISKTILPDFDSKKAMLLYHMLLSHHGKKEFGSPVVPKTKESYILSKADELSCFINHIDNLKVMKDGWTGFDEITKTNWMK